MKVVVVTTGGTIAKTYDEQEGSLRIDRPIVEQILAGLRLPDLDLTYQHLLSKDSLELTEADRRLIVEAVQHAIHEADAVLVAHGTDTMALTGDRLYADLKDLCVPVILTGAMRPYEFRDSDAVQNITEALLACRLVDPGVYLAMHNRVLRFPGVVKDRAAQTFTKH